MKSRLLSLLKIVIVGYILLCSFLYFFQEKLIFHPQKLDKDYKFQFNQKFEELVVPSYDGAKLNGLLFKTDSLSKGLIIYLHGNAGSLQEWGSVAKFYTDIGYDIFLLDYRSFGKSEGSIKSESQLYQDNQAFYDTLKMFYSENKITILGYSIGTGMAAMLASNNNPKLLILQAPYYNLTDLKNQWFSFVPNFILKYKFSTNDILEHCKIPLIIFHGDQDELINLNASIKLKSNFRSDDTLIILKGQGHNGMTENLDYQSNFRKLLNIVNHF